MKWINRASKWLIAGAVLMATGAGGGGCLTRPVGTQPPTTKVNFTAQLAQQQVDKVDLLFMIDNSPSMADKQVILSEAVPNLLNGLLKPQCVKSSDGTTPIDPPQVADPNGTTGNNYGCPAGSQPEFKPITDMHIGIISSSLGSFGGDACLTTDTPPQDIPPLNDHGRLLNQVQNGTPLPAASPSNFLAWFPTNEENRDTTRHPTPPVTPIGDFVTLRDDFQQLVQGVGQDGCFLEAQLESVYRFLVQPDPWVTVSVGSSVNPDISINQADLSGTDGVLLKQRADFLRPDSLVAVIMLTDEDDSSVDPLSLNGIGYQFMNFEFTGSDQRRTSSSRTSGKTAPRATSACTDPNSPNCTSCLFLTKEAQSSDPECQKGTYYGPTEDDLNVRFFHMKQRFGVDPQYPLQRYIDGFTKARVPNRGTEHVITTSANGTRNVAPYTYAPTCTNPLFAAKLPASANEELCNLTPGSRTSDLVFFAVIGGVPHQLLTDLKWETILGKDPVNFDYTGISPYMVQSTEPRTGIPYSKDYDKLGINSIPGQPDDIVGRDYKTQQTDLQYACTFDLPASSSPRPCTGTTNCDCDFTAGDPPVPVVQPPLCSELRKQIKAKAYPTPRPFSVVRALNNLGTNQGIIASLCPITLDPSLKDDPEDKTYGYKPAVASIINRLKNALTQQCLPRQLTRDSQQKVPCLVLARLAEGDTCDKYKDDQGQPLKPPEPAILSTFLKQQKEASGDVANGGVDLSQLAVCQVPQITVAQGDSCKTDTNIGWCYVEKLNNDAGSATKNPAGRCTQALLFSAGSAEMAGATFFLQCIQQFTVDAGATDASN